MISAPNRRWPTFTLRTLFVVVTVLACWLAWTAYHVSEHNRVARLLLDANGTGTTSITAVWDDEGEEWKLDVRGRLPIGWRLFGAIPVDSITLDSDATESDFHDYTRLFPEAYIFLPAHRLAREPGGG